jgi:phosphatidylinositol alpha-1,6-mannosyltransferase
VVQAPLLGAITRHPTGGGVAVVANLVWRVFEEHWGSNARLETLFTNENHVATIGEKARFGMAVAKAQLLKQTDWVLFSHLALAQVQRFVPASRRRPYGVFLHGIEAWAPLTANEKRVVAGADLRIANSQFTASRVMAIHPDLGHVEACPLALPKPNDESTNRSQTGHLVLGPHAVLVVGRMVQSERYKGHDQLIEAWPAVLASVPDAQLVVVGEGDDTARLREKARGCAGVTFTGFVPRAELESLYRQSALFALPSDGEGFGLVYLEAMTHRLACVGSAHDAAAEVIVDGVTGCLLDQRNIPGLADSLVALLTDESRRRAMGEAGYRRAVEEFSYERFSCRLRQLLVPDDRGRVHPSN